MTRVIDIKPVYNKKNGQINFSLPKRKMPKEIPRAINAIKKMRISFLDWE